MTNYERGVALERKIQHFYEYNGYYCMRSAGSHGLADLIVIFPSKVCMIQVKLHDKLRDEIRERHLKQLECSPNIEKWIAWKINKRVTRQGIKHNNLIMLHNLIEPSISKYITPLSDEEERNYQAMKKSMFALFKSKKQLSVIT